MVATLCHSAQAADSASICAQLAQHAGTTGSLYAKPERSELRHISALTLDDAKGKTVHFFYVIRRSEAQLPKYMSGHGVVVVKSEQWSPGAPNEVSLYNNHRENDPTFCRLRSFAIYQEFHINGAIDNCLALGFHNVRGFTTAEPPDRRSLFAFYEPKFLGLFRWWNRDAESVKRQAFILNYGTPQERPPICVPFFLYVSAEVSKVRIVVADLQEDRLYQRIPPIWWEK
jgi:hypothetical protein